jgi:hypothetical protein
LSRVLSVCFRLMLFRHGICLRLAPIPTRCCC